MRRPIMVAAATLLAAAGHGQDLDEGPGARPHLLSNGRCQVQLFEPWAVAGSEAAAGDGSVAQIMAVAGPEIVVDMVEGTAFARVERTGQRLVYERRLPNGGRHFRSVTRSRPGCAASVIARSRSSVETAARIARSIAAVDR